MNLNKLMVFSVTGLIGSCVSYSLFDKEVSKALQKTPVHDEVMEKVRAHKGALLFLGEPIEPVKAKYNNFSMKIDGYAEIKMPVTGPKANGIVFYTFVEDEQSKNNLLKSIQLQIGKDDTKRLVIFSSNENKPVSE